jgi:hypothetical protein
LRLIFRLFRTKNLDLHARGHSSFVDSPG